MEYLEVRTSLAILRIENMALIRVEQCLQAKLVASDSYSIEEVNVFTQHDRYLCKLGVKQIASKEVNLFLDEVLTRRKFDPSIVLHVSLRGLRIHPLKLSETTGKQCDSLYILAFR